MTEKFFTVKEFAEKMKYDPQTIRKMIRNGRIHAFKLGDDGPYRIPDTELERLMIIGYRDQMNILKETLNEE